MDDALAAAIRDAAADGIEFDGLAVECSGAACSVKLPQEGFTQVGTDAIEELLDSYPAYAHNWHFWHATAPQKDDRWAFLRWLEGAETTPVAPRYDALQSGVTETWGQLAITVQIDEESERSYDITHVDDLTDEASSAEDDQISDEDESGHGEPPSLERFEDPQAAREIARLDEKGRYRPLKTAPSLSTGWHLADLDASEVVRAVEWFYPATIANWHRERQGELDVTHWEETADRQTGIYAVIEELPDEAVDWMAGACCDDSQCLKRRQWDRSAGDPLDTPRGDGHFPCREPCSLVTAAARKWTTLENESPRTYEIELTLSEMNQLSEIVDAVAEDREDEIREADVNDGANRYRARYLRAKLFEDDGLPFEETATDHEESVEH